MKTLLKKTEPKAILIVLLFTISTLFISCYGDPIDRDLEVETITVDILGNDAVTTDKTGNVYISDYGQFENTGGTGTRVIKISRDGEVSDFVTDLVGPLGNGFDNQGNFYVNHAGNLVTGEVLKVTPEGAKQVLATIDWMADRINLGL